MNYTLHGLRSDTMTGDDNIDEFIQGIVANIRDAYQPEKVFLFGSYAYGTPDQDSDIDLLVVTTKTVSRREIQEIRRGFFEKTHVSLQIVAVDSKEFDETRDVIGGITYPAAKYGKLLYEKS